MENKLSHLIGALELRTLASRLGVNSPLTGRTIHVVVTMMVM